MKNIISYPIKKNYLLDKIVNTLLSWTSQLDLCAKGGPLGTQLSNILQTNVSNIVAFLFVLQLYKKQKKTTTFIVLRQQNVIAFSYVNNLIANLTKSKKVIFLWIVFR
mgnify:CR=1 FL=1